MFNDQIDTLLQAHNARKAIIGLLQACETANEADVFVPLHHLGQLMQLIDNAEQQAFEAIENPSAIVKVA